MSSIAKLPYTTKLDTIEIILKITSRCNLDCTYCYYFNGENQIAKHLPAVLSKDNIINIANFVEEGIKELGLNYVTFDFHGGEPLMMNKERFDWMCNHFVERLGNLVKLNFALQTNAVNVDEEWIDLFDKYKLAVGVSIDGPKEYNDMYRIDLKGNSSYKKTRDGIELLTKAWREKKLGGLGALCVVNPDFEARKIYEHLTQTLGFKGLDFLLPDFTHQDYVPHEGYKKFMRDMFDAWVEFGFDKASVRKINGLLKRFAGEKRSFFNSFSSEETSMIAFTIQSDATIGPDDTFFNTPVWERIENEHVSDTSLRQFLSQPEIERLDAEARQIPKACKSCCWQNVCGGGGLSAHQYSANNDSTLNPSVHCEALKELYSTACAYLLENGMSPVQLTEVLFPNESDNLLQSSTTA